MLIIFCNFFLVLNFILSSISTCSGQVQGNESTLSSFETNESTLAFLQSNLSIENDTKIKLDTVFGMDVRIFQEYLEDEDLTIIPGIQEDDDFENWTPPPELARDFPSYMSGFDSHDRPIWVYEWGKWRFGKYAEGSQEKLVLFGKYMRFLMYTLLKSQAIRSTKERRVTTYICILEYAGFLPESVLNRKTLQLQVAVFSSSRRLFEKYSAKTIALNVTPVSEVLLNIHRPFINRLLDRFEVYGTNKYIWAPQLLKTIPKDQLPEWYGGNKGYVPFHRF